MGTVEPLPPDTTLDQFRVKNIGFLHLPFLCRWLVKINWKNEKRKNPSLTADPVHFVVWESEDRRSYDVIRSTYDVFKFLSKLHSYKRLCHLLERHQWLKSLTGLKTLMSLYLVNVVTIPEGEDFLLFAKSGPNTHHAGKFFSVGGMLDHENMADEHPFYSNYQKELKEELALDASDPKHISSYSVAFLGRRDDGSVELIVLAQTPLNRSELQDRQQHADAEFSGLYYLPKKKKETREFLGNVPAHKQWENLEPVLRHMFDL